MAPPPPRYALVVTARALPDLRVFMASLGVWHGHGPHGGGRRAPTLFLLCDTGVAEFLRGGAAAAYPGAIAARVELDAYSAETRASMEAARGRRFATLWDDFMALKTDALRWALTAAALPGSDESPGAPHGAWFVDCDLCFLAPPPAAPPAAGSATGVAAPPIVALSPHDMDAGGEAAFGAFNAGVVWAADARVADWWLAAMPRSRFYDQAALEEVASEARAAGGDGAVALLPHALNFGAWRVFRPAARGATPLDMLGRVAFAPPAGGAGAGFTLLDAPLVAVHTHLAAADPFNAWLLDALDAAAAQWPPAAALVGALGAAAKPAYRCLPSRHTPLGAGGGAPLYPPFMVRGGDVEAAVGAELARRHPTGVVHGALFLRAAWTAAYLRPTAGAERGSLQAWVNAAASHVAAGAAGPAFFTIVQHDDGVHQHALPPGTLVFAAGGTGDVPLPLWYDDGGLLASLGGTRRGFGERPLLASFVGSVTHAARAAMVEALQRGCPPDVLLRASGTWTPAPTGAQTAAFVTATLQSRFGLAPRGYGRTSFRVLEVARLGAVPVVVHDGEPWLPLTDVVDWGAIAVLVHVSELPRLEAQLRGVSEAAWRAKRDAFAAVAHHFTAAGMASFVERELARRRGDAARGLRCKEPTS
jgi:hypothetical protein